jgi:NOL1/NOP2/fmu family ribosome biogenesis protein
MQNLKILNKKETKEILNAMRSQWGFEGELEYAFLKTEKGKIYIAKREVFDLDLAKMKINSIGMYFGEMRNGLRLSIEGSQLVGPGAKKNVVELNDDEARQWLSGIDIDKESPDDIFVIIRHGDDFIGTGKAKEGKILNFVPKTRRIIKNS